MHITKKERVGRWIYLTLSLLVLVFLLLPILVILPLSFNAEPYFSFTNKMLSFDPSGYSLRWYESLVDNPEWRRSIKNSFYIGIFATVIATTLGTLASLGLTRREMPYRNLILSLLISPLVMPLIISAVGMFFFFAFWNLNQTFIGAILAHSVLGIPFVVITVTATLSGFNENLIRAGKSLGADNFTVFRKITAPLIAPGIISGALFAFVTSFDEVVVILFVGGYDQKTITLQMWSGIREQISPTILAVASLFFLLSVFLLATLELIRRRNEKLTMEV